MLFKRQATSSLNTISSRSRSQQLDRQRALSYTEAMAKQSASKKRTSALKAREGGCLCGHIRFEVTVAAGKPHIFLTNAASAFRVTAVRRESYRLLIAFWYHAGTCAAIGRTKWPALTSTSGWLMKELPGARSGLLISRASSTNMRLRCAGSGTGTEARSFRV
jgi:hypothetical protein